MVYHILLLQYNAYCKFSHYFCMHLQLKFLSLKCLTLPSNVKSNHWDYSKCTYYDSGAIMTTRWRTDNFRSKTSQKPSTRPCLITDNLYFVITLRTYVFSDLLTDDPISPLRSSAGGLPAVGLDPGLLRGAFSFCGPTFWSPSQLCPHSKANSKLSYFARLMIY